MSGTPPKSSRELLEERIRQERAERRAAVLRAAPSGEIAAADLAALQAARSSGAAPAPAPAAIGNVLPLAARIAKADPERMINVPVCEADLAKYKGRPFDKKAWLAAVERALQTHDFGNVHRSTVILACRELADAAEGGKGMAQWTYDLWASFARCCRSTMHKIVRALWDTQLVRILNPFYWVGREQRRAPNAYLPTMPADEPAEAEAAPPAASESPSPAPAPSGAVKAMQRMEAAVRELLPFFPGLVARVFGMNTSPLRQERRSAPA